MNGGAVPVCNNNMCPGVGRVTRDGRRQLIMGTVTIISVSRNSEVARKLLNPVRPIDSCRLFPGQTCKAVLAHEGHNVNSGHWKAFIQHHGRWWCVDTTRIRPSEENPFANQREGSSGTYTLDVFFFW